MLLFDFSGINFATTCETDVSNVFVPSNSTSSNFSALGVLQSYTDNTSYTLATSTEIKECYSPVQTYWVLFSIVFAVIFLTYRVIKFYK